jgi:hypothetical protein
MAELTITIPDEQVQRVLDSVASRFPIPMVDDPENDGELIPKWTKPQNVRMVTARFLRDTVKRAERKAAAAAIADVDIDIS